MDLKQWLSERWSKDGVAHLDMYVAKEFARLSGRPEDEVLSILCRQETIFLAQESGRGKFARARRNACHALAHGWDIGMEVSQSTYTSVLAAFELATAYAIMARRGR
jgi:hypothetical protein